jgi:hypothetical protein
MVATVDPLVFVSCSSTWSSGKHDVVAGAVPFTAAIRARTGLATQQGKSSQRLEKRQSAHSGVESFRGSHRTHGCDASWRVVDTASRKGLDASPVEARARGSEAMKPSIVCKAC